MIEFLPQYAAKAVADMEELVESVDKAMEACKGNPEKNQMLTEIIRGGDNAALYDECKFMASTLRAAVHIVLPTNGEVYRSNYPAPIPTADEIESLRGLPAPTTCFEFYCSNLAPPTKIVCVIIDRKQLNDGQTGIVVFLAREHEGTFPPARHGVYIPEPYEFAYEAESASRFGVVCSVFPLSKYRDRIPSEAIDRKATAVQNVLWGLSAAIQCCHSLRAGASLEEAKETSANRRWKMERRGVGGFTYHVLKLPHGREFNNVQTGTHESPRFHIRRAHIRKLPTGVLTFVRQCFVGDANKGIVDKHYSIEKML